MHFSSRQDQGETFIGMPRGKARHCEFSQDKARQGIQGIFLEVKALIFLQLYTVENYFKNYLPKFEMKKQLTST